MPSSRSPWSWPLCVAFASSSLMACVETLDARDATVDVHANRDADAAPRDDAAAQMDSLGTHSDSASDSSDGSSSMPQDSALSDARPADASSACLGQPFGAMCAEGLACDGRGQCAIRRPCAFENAGRWWYPDGARRRLLETIFAYGRYYNFWINPDGTSEPLNPGGNPTASVERWRGAGRPCGASDPCTLESFNLWTNPGDPAIVETVLRSGRYFTYASAQAYRLVDSGLLENITRFAPAANGPCTDQFEGSCRFDTRSLVMDWGASQLVREEITARGRRWVFDGAGRPVPSVSLGQPLTEVPRYAPADGQGPCVGAGPCRFDAHFHDPTTGDEFVIARGRLFAWANDAENTRRYAAGYGNELHTFARYAAGPCRVAP